MVQPPLQHQDQGQCQRQWFSRPRKRPRPRPIVLEAKAEATTLMYSSCFQGRVQTTPSAGIITTAYSQNRHVIIPPMRVIIPAFLFPSSPFSTPLLPLTSPAPAPTHTQTDRQTDIGTDTHTVSVCILRPHAARSAGNFSAQCFFTCSHTSSSKRNLSAV